MSLILDVTEKTVLVGTEGIPIQTPLSLIDEYTTVAAINTVHENKTDPHSQYVKDSVVGGMHTADISVGIGGNTIAASVLENNTSNFARVSINSSLVELTATDGVTNRALTVTPTTITGITAGDVGAVAARQAITINTANGPSVDNAYPLQPNIDYTIKADSWNTYFSLNITAPNEKFYFTTDDSNSNCECVTPVLVTETTYGQSVWTFEAPAESFNFGAGTFEIEVNGSLQGQVVKRSTLPAAVAGSQAHTHQGSGATDGNYTLTAAEHAIAIAAVPATVSDANSISTITVTANALSISNVFTGGGEVYSSFICNSGNATINATDTLTINAGTVVGLDATDVGAVPTSRTINGLPLTGDITLANSGGLSASYNFCDDVIFAGTSPVWHELERQSDGGTTGSHTATTSSYTEMDRYVTAALNTTIIPAGTWDFTLYCKLNAVQKEGQIKALIYRVDSAGAIVGSVIGTAESAVFTNTTVAPIRCSIYTAAQSSWALTDRLGIVIQGKRGTEAGTMTFYHDAASGWASRVETPLVLLHNQLAGLNQDDYQHLTSAQKTIATQAASGSVSGYINTSAQTLAGGKSGSVTALTANASVAVNLSLNNNFSLAVASGTAHTLAEPSNPVVGQSGIITITNHASSVGTLAYNAAWLFSGSDPTLTATTGAIDILAYYVISASPVKVVASMIKGVA